MADDEWSDYNPPAAAAPAAASDDSWSDYKPGAPGTDAIATPSNESATPLPGVTNAIKGAVNSVLPGWGEDWDAGQQGAGFRAKTGAVASGMLGGIPFSKDIAAGAGQVAKTVGQGIGFDTSAIPDYSTSRQAIDARTAALTKDHPYYSMAGSIAGAGALSPIMPAATIGQAARTGMVYGAAQGAGEGNDMSSRLRGAGWGAGLGAIGGTAGGIFGSAFRGATPEMADAADAAGQMNIPLPRAVAGSPLDQTLGRFVSATPVGGGIAKATQAAAAKTGDAIADQAGALGSGTKQGAVNNAVPALRDWMDSGFKAEAQKIYSPLNRLNGSPALGDMPNTRAAAQQIMRQAAGKNAAKEYTPAVQDVLDAATRPGGLSFSDMNGLKMDLGKSAAWDERGDAEGFKRLYGALNDDVRAHAQAIGGNQGLVNYDTANSQFQGLLDQAGGVRKLLGTGSDESVVDRFKTLSFDSAGRQGKGGDLNTIARVKSAVPQPVYDELVSSMVGSLGQTADGSGTTSMAGFLQDYAKMSPTAKTQIFSTPASQQVRTNLDQINKIAGVLKDAKPTGAEHLGGTLVGAEQGIKFVENVAKGEWGKALAQAGAAAVGKTFANYLASPVGSGVAARAMRAYARFGPNVNPATLGRAGGVAGAQFNSSLQGATP